MLPFSASLLEVNGECPEAYAPVSFDGHISEQTLEDWIVDNPQLVGEPLLVLGRQLAEFEEDQDRLDILAVDQGGGRDCSYRAQGGRQFCAEFRARAPRRRAVLAGLRGEAARIWFPRCVQDSEDIARRRCFHRA
jgi:hypothetical protein